MYRGVNNDNMNDQCGYLRQAIAKEKHFKNFTFFLDTYVTSYVLPVCMLDSRRMDGDIRCTRGERYCVTASA